MGKLVNGNEEWAYLTFLVVLENYCMGKDWSQLLFLYIVKVTYDLHSEKKVFAHFQWYENIHKMTTVNNGRSSRYSALEDIHSGGGHIFFGESVNKWWQLSVSVSLKGPFLFFSVQTPELWEPERSWELCNNIFFPRAALFLKLASVYSSSIQDGYYGKEIGGSNLQLLKIMLCVKNGTFL